MTLSLEQLIGLKVRTQSGLVLGRVKDFELEAETGRIARYVVADGGWLPKLLSQDLLVDQTQVVQITEAEMIVEDGLVEAKAAVGEAAV